MFFIEIPTVCLLMFWSVFAERARGCVQFRRRIHHRKTSIDSTQRCQDPQRRRAATLQGLFLHGRLVLRRVPARTRTKPTRQFETKIMWKKKKFNEKNDSNATCDLTTWAVWSDSFWNRNKILITLNLILIFLISDTAPVLRGVGTKTRRKLVKKNVIKAKTINSRFPHVLNYPPYCYYILHNLPIPPKNVLSNKDVFSCKQNASADYYL